MGKVNKRHLLHGDRDAGELRGAVDRCEVMGFSVYPFETGMITAYGILRFLSP
jgi:hypothetical protein